jgi:hypothetical protein
MTKARAFSALFAGSPAGNTMLNTGRDVTHFLLCSDENFSS